MNIKIGLSMLLVALASSVTVHAQSDIELPQGFELSSKANLVSDYIFRGESKTANRPAVQQTIFVDHESGLYAGLFGTSISSSTADLETRYYLGFKSNFNDLFDYNLGIVYYDQIGSGTTDPILNGSAEFDVTLGYELNDLGYLSANVGYGLDDDAKLYFAAEYESLFNLSLTVGSLEDVGLHVDINYDVLTVSEYSLGAQVTVLTPEDAYKTANNLEDSELAYSISLSKAF